MGRGRRDELLAGPGADWFGGVAADSWRGACGALILPRPPPRITVASGSPLAVSVTQMAAAGASVVLAAAGPSVVLAASDGPTVAGTLAVGVILPPSRSCMTRS